MHGTQSRHPNMMVENVATLPSPPLPLEVGPLNTARGCGERCKLPQWVRGKAAADKRFGAYRSHKVQLWWHQFLLIFLRTNGGSNSIITGRCPMRSFFFSRGSRRHCPMEVAAPIVCDSWPVRRQTHGYLPSRTALLLYLGRYPFLVPPRVAHMLFISAYTWHIGLRVLYASSPADIATVLSYIRGTKQLRYRLACRGSGQSCLTNEKCMSHSFMLR